MNLKNDKGLDNKKCLNAKTEDIFASNSQEKSIPRKDVKINLKKLQINKVDQDKYNQSDTKCILDLALPEDINYKIKDKSIPVKDILKPITRKDLVEKFKEENQVKEFKLRDNKGKTELTENFRKLNETLRREIETEQLDLIRYLNSKSQISKKLVEKISELDNTQMTKLNRICKIFTNYNERVELYRNRISEKLNIERKNVQKNAKEMVTDIDDYLLKCNGILQPYEKRISKKFKNVLAYQDLHFEVENKYWKKLEQKNFMKSNESNMLKKGIAQ